LSEAQRVEKFVQVVEDSTITDEEKGKLLGKIMNESQKSCEELYDNSSEEINKLIKICNQIAYGSKMSGWGWGGCCIALVKEEDCEKLIDNIMNEYYLDKANHLAITDDLKMYVFSSKPGLGAGILDPQYEFWY